MSRLARHVLKDIEELFFPWEEQKSQQLLDECNRLENSFFDFCSEAWQKVEGQPFIPGWFPEALTIHLEACYFGYIKNLIINCPPRMGKSTIVSVLFNSWVWCREPQLKFAFASYGSILSERDSRKTLELIESDWYQERWGDKVKLNPSLRRVEYFGNLAKGERFTTSINSSSTGFGAHIRILDDPNNIQHVKSQADRDNINRFASEVWPTRIADPRRDCQILSQQRSDVDDASGFIIMNDIKKHWCVLSLPMEYEAANKCITFPFENEEVWEDPRQEENELLHPDYMPLEMVDQWKAFFHYDERRIAGQLQQRPVALGGNIIKEKWFKKWTESSFPRFDYIVQSWDTAVSDRDDPSTCFSACTTWGVFKNDENPQIKDVMLLSCYQDRLDFPDLYDRILRLWNNWQDTDKEESAFPASYINHPSVVLIEESSISKNLLQVIRRTNVNLVAFNPKKYGDKTHRVLTVSHLIANGRVWLRTSKESNYQDLNEESALFVKYVGMFSPTSPNDITDSMSQALIHLETTNQISHNTYRRSDNQVYERPDYFKLKPSHLMMKANSHEKSSFF